MKRVEVNLAQIEEDFDFNIKSKRYCSTRFINQLLLYKHRQCLSR